MNRRNFFKVVTGFVAGVCTVFVPKAKANLNNLKLLPSSVRKRSGRDEIVNKFLLSDDTHLIFSDNWKFYINGKEVDSNRAVDDFGTLHWPFQGVKKGDLCTAKSPMYTISGILPIAYPTYIV